MKTREFNNFLKFLIDLTNTENLNKTILYFDPKLPVKKIVKALIKNKIPASISNTAGTFVCNHLMYGLLYLIDKKYPDILGGFIHVPFIPEQTLHKEAPSMSLDDITKGLTVAIETTVEIKRNPAK